MAINRSTEYPGRFDDPDASYPQGKFKNRSEAGVEDGSYIDEKWMNDQDGFLQALLHRAGITPSGVPDTAINSDYFNAANLLWDGKNISVGTTADLRALDAKVGLNVLRTGYYESGDGGGAPYIIEERDGSPDDGGSVIFLDNGLQAQLVGSGDVGIKQFGAVTNGVTDDSAAIQAAFDTGKKCVFPSKYSCVINSALTAGVGDIDFGTAEILSNVGGPVITLTSAISITGGKFSTANASEIFIGKTGGIIEGISITGSSFDGGFRGIDITGSKDITIDKCRFVFMSSDGIRNYGMEGGRVTNCYFEGTGAVGSLNHAATLAGTGIGKRVIFSGNIVNRTGDTALFMRAFDNSTVGQMIASDNHFYGVGKVAIKFTSPAGDVNALVENCIASGNTIDGFAVNVVGAGAVESFADSAVGGVCKNIAITGNVITQDASLAPAGGDGILVTDCENATITGNIITGAEKIGMVLSATYGLSCVGNIVDGCCTDLSGADIDDNGAIVVVSCRDVTLNNVIRNTGSAMPALVLNKTQGASVSGVIDTAANFGVWLSGTGASGAKTSYCSLNGLTVRNTAGVISYDSPGVSNNISEVNCFDDSGSRHFGSTARRDALGLSSSNTHGFAYYNNTNSRMEFWMGSLGWRTTDGSAV